MFLFRIITFFFYFIYFLSLLCGYPEYKTQILKEIDLTQSETHFYWRIGTVKETWVQYQTLSNLEEPLLKGDAKPKEVFRNLNRVIVQKIFFTLLNLFWLTLLGLCLICLHLSYPFLRPLSTILLTISTIYVSLNFILASSETQTIHPFFNYYPIKFASEKFLIIISLADLIWQFFSGRKKLYAKKNIRVKYKKIHFLQTSLQKILTLSIHSNKLLIFLLHFLTICFISAILANLILFPLYYLQLTFPHGFAFFLTGLLLILIIYYSYAYKITMTSSKSKVSFSIGLTFLCYRILQNTILVTSALILIILLMISIILFTIYNIDTLTNIAYN